MRVAVLLLALTAALSIWPCAAAPRSLEPEYVRIANAADARLENAVVQELTPPQAMPPSGSSYQNKCRSQRMRFGTQNLRGFRDKAKMQEVRCNMTDRGTAILALQETWHINDINVSMDDGYRLIGAGNGIRNGNYDSVNGVAFMLSPKIVPAFEAAGKKIYNPGDGRNMAIFLKFNQGGKRSKKDHEKRKQNDPNSPTERSKLIGFDTTVMEGDSDEAAGAAADCFWGGGSVRGHRNDPPPAR